MQIEVGKRYYTRKEDVVEIVKNDGTRFYPFIGVFADKTRTSFSEDGEFLIGRKNDNDLVKELPTGA